MKNSIFLILLFISLLISGCQKHPNLTPFEQNQLWGYKDPSGRVIIPPQYILAQNFNPHGIAAVVDPHRNAWIYINTQNQFVIKPYIYDNGPDPFVEGLARFKQNGKIGFFNEQGKIVIPAQYEFAYPFQNGLSQVGQNVRFIREKNSEYTTVVADHWGFINKRGELTIPYRYETILTPFTNPNFAIVTQNGQKLKINREGKVVGKG